MTQITGEFIYIPEKTEYATIYDILAEPDNGTIDIFTGNKTLYFNRRFIDKDYNISLDTFKDCMRHLSIDPDNGKASCIIKKGLCRYRHDFSYERIRPYLEDMLD